MFYCSGAVNCFCTNCYEWLRAVFGSQQEGLHVTSCHSQNKWRIWMTFECFWSLKGHAATHRDTEICPSALPVISYSFAPAKMAKIMPLPAQCLSMRLKIVADELLGLKAWTPSTQSTRSTRLSRRLIIWGDPLRIKLKALRREKLDKKRTNKIKMTHAPVVSRCIMYGYQIQGLLCRALVVTICTHVLII